jgi:hypothetical protein
MELHPVIFADDGAEAAGPVFAALRRGKQDMRTI